MNEYDRCLIITVIAIKDEFNKEIDYLWAPFCVIVESLRCECYIFVGFFFFFIENNSPQGFPWSSSDSH